MVYVKVVMITGKQITGFWLDEFIEMEKKIKWISTARRFTLAARVEIQPRGFEVGINEADMDPIQKWCEEHNCGVRTSFDMIKFKNKKEMTMFLLRWG